jgi:hypothetical protein
MAVMNKWFVSTKRDHSAEQIAGFAAEQRRLKADAAKRRIAAAARETVSRQGVR